MLLLWWVLWVNFFNCAVFSAKREIDGDSLEKIAIKSPGQQQVHVPSKFNRMRVSLTGACGGLNDHGILLLNLFIVHF